MHMYVMYDQVYVLLYILPKFNKTCSYIVVYLVNACELGWCESESITNRRIYSQTYSAKPWFLLPHSTS